MDREKLTKEIDRCLDWLASHEVTHQDYDAVSNRYSKLTKLLMEYDEFSDKLNERQDKLDIEKDKIKGERDLKDKDLELKSRELDLKEKELELKNNVDNQKIQNDAEEAKARRKHEKRQAVWEIIKIGVSTVATGVLIICTGKAEEAAILGQHKWSLIPKVLK